MVYSAADTQDAEFIMTVVGQGEVFDPAATYASDMISVSGSAFTDSVKTYVSAEDNTDGTYGGAYWQFTVPGTGWADIKLTPVLALDDYAKYDYVTVWLYIGQKSGEADGIVSIPFGNSNYHKRKVMTGEWTKIVLVKAVDGMTGNTADNVFHTGWLAGNETSADSFNFNKFITASWAANTEVVRIGEITGKYFGDQTAQSKVVFDPSSENVASSVGQDVAGTLTTTGVENPASNGGYSGACVMWTPPSGGWGNLYVRPTEGELQDYFGYAQLKVWIYIKTASGTPTDYEFLMCNQTRCRQKVKTDTWVELTIDFGWYTDYIGSNTGNSGKPYFISQKWTGETVYIGTMTAYTFE